MQHEGTVHAGQFPLGTKKSRKFATIGLPSSSPAASWVDPATFLKKNTGKPCVSASEWLCMLFGFFYILAL